MRRAAATAAVVLMAVAAGCGDDGDTGTGDPAAGGQGEAPAGMVHVHGLGIDPADGALYVATHFGMWRMGGDDGAERVGPVQDVMGFTVADERTFLASGHPGPDGLAAGDPPNLGLLESTDGGESWEELSLGGDVDFHALRSAHDRIYGWSSTSSEFMVSEDGTTWDTRSTVPIHDFAIDPEDPGHLVMGGPDGVAVSDDEGRTWEPVEAAPELVLVAWDPDSGLWGADADGGLHRADSPTGAWEEVGALPGPPQALLVDGDTVYAAASEAATGIYRSDDGARSWETLYTDTGG